MTQLDFSHPWQIVVSSSDPTAALAMTELAVTLRRITGQAFSLAASLDASTPSLVLSHGHEADDGFRWQVTPAWQTTPGRGAAADRVEIYGRNPRGLLYAIYDFLEALGCRWVAPGKEGERIPQGTCFDVPDGPVDETPALPGRCLIVGHYAFMQDVEEWIVWAAHNRLNTLFLHVIEDPLAFGAAPASQWQARKKTAVPLADQRGMTIEHGGHGLAALLPRKLFKKMPDLFRERNGKRTPDHNFCPSSEEALAIVRQNARAHFCAHPEVEVFHLWPDDIPGGGWCECERCKDYTPSELGLMAINAVAEELAQVNPHAQISFIAYMDTEQAPTRIAPRANVCMLWAPRCRCYTHATDEPTCGVNVPHYAEHFRAQEAHFRTAGAKPPRIFEYYLDAILFKSLLPPLPAVMQRDIRFYRDAGADTVQALMTGDRPWLAPQLNAWLFARLCWNPDQDIDALLADFGRATFGTAAVDWAAHYRALEKAFALALDIAPEQINLEFEMSIQSLVDNPMADMGDPAFAPLGVLRQKSQANAAIKELVQEAARILEAAKETADPAAWAAGQAEFELTRAWLRFDLSRVRLYEAVASKPVLPDAYQRFKDAQTALNDVLAWGEAHLDDRRFRLNFWTMHWMFWQLRLSKIRADHFSWRPFHRLPQAGVLAQLGATFLRLRGLYE